MKKKIGVVLSGCGVYDGAEIHEATITLLAIDRAGCEAVCFAPSGPQARVVDHLTGDEAGESRDALVESARIARGEIRDLSDARADDLDAVVFPGGFGAATTLCDFATAGAACSSHPEAERVAREFAAARKPIGAMCIAPALIAAVFGKEDPPVRLTIGSDPETAAKLEAMGAVHEKRPVDGVCVDEARRIVTTPAYMLAGSIGEAAAGIEKLVAAVVDMS